MEDQERIAKLRQEAAAFAESAAALQKRSPQPGQENKELIIARNLALTSLALSLAAQGLSSPPLVIG